MIISLALNSVITLASLLNFLMTSVWRELYQTVGQLGLQPLQGLLRPLEVAEAPQPQILQPLHSCEVEETLVSDVAIAGQMQPLKPVLKQKNLYITECPNMIWYHIYNY